MFFRKNLARNLALTVGLSLLCLSAGAAQAATGNNSVQAVIQAYNAPTNLQLGVIVGLKSGDASAVVPLSQQNIKDMQGVVVSPNDSPVTLTPAKSSAAQVFVATSGRHNVAVSTQAGPIHSGDYITISSIAGIGMKAGTSQSFILGRAADDFDGTSSVEGSASLKDTTGQTTSVSLGRVPVDINIAHNPLERTPVSHSPNWLEKIGNTVANKPVNTGRLYLAAAVLVATVLMAGSLLIAGVRSGMVAVGRNPMARGTIMRSLAQVVLVSLIVFVIGVFAVYLLVKL